MSSTTYDTLLVASSEENFAQLFLLEHRWYGARIDRRRLSSLKWLALYRRAPVSAITHYAAIVGTREDPKTGRYLIEVDPPLTLIRPIVMSGTRRIPIQGQRYLLLQELLGASEIADIIGRRN